jgi:glycosyltransferase involved in cell wall biosynthesis
VSTECGAVRWRAVSGPLVVLCLATHEPDRILLERQLESIRGQSHGNWVCLVSDDASSARARATLETLTAGDERFRVVWHESRVGFYRNFEQCLALASDEADYVALADQDDVWHPDKLAALVDALERRPEALLAYGDMRVITNDGRVLAESSWLDRGNNWTDLAALVLTNTVTGAASLVRRSLLDRALPFPPPVGRAYHDHWLACVALALGPIVFVDRPLQDYVQHEEQAVGRGVLADDLRGGLARAFGRFLRQPRRRARATAAHARRYYEEELVWRRALAGELERRFGLSLPPALRRDVRRLTGLGTARSALWLLGRSARDLRGTSPTLGIENQLLKATAWHWTRRRRRA